MASKSVSKIFISYRRADSSKSAGRLRETLTRHFGARQVFFDYDTIEGGEVFDQSIQNALGSSKVLLAVIGRDWLTITERNKRRLDDVKDRVRLEIATALRRDIDVIPVLVDGASLPREEDLPDELQKLVGRQYVILSDQKWREDAKRLVGIIENNLGKIHPYSLLSGAIAGLAAGMAFAVVSRLQGQIVEWWKPFAVGFFGFLAGLILSWTINGGIATFSRLLRWSSFSEIIGGIIGGAIGGVLAAILGAAGFIKIDVEVVNPLGAATAVEAATIFIAGSMLYSELKESWYKRLVVVVSLTLVTTVAMLLTTWIFKGGLQGFAEQFAFEHPISPGVLILGAICGIMSGFQVGLALVIYERFPKR